MANTVSEPIDFHTSFQTMKETSEDLPLLVVSESERRHIPFEVSPSHEKLSLKENEKIVINDFDKRKDLKFTVEVNLRESKRAFQALLSGLSKDADFNDLWSLHDHNPLTFPHPIGGDIDPKVLEVREI